MQSLKAKIQKCNQQRVQVYIKKHLKRDVRSSSINANAILLKNQILANYKSRNLIVHSAKSTVFGCKSYIFNFFTAEIAK
jgi:Na+-translocating ferredoxin:NAD+ oxidoreductase RnfC subunit